MVYLRGCKEFSPYIDNLKYIFPMKTSDCRFVMTNVWNDKAVTGRVKWPFLAQSTLLKYFQESKYY